MTQVNQLSAVTAIADGDSIPLFSLGTGGLVRVAASTLREYVNEDVELPGGILAASSVYALVADAFAPNLGAAYANFTGYNPNKSLILPAGSASLVPMPLTGEFIAGRDIQALLVNVNIAMTYANTRELTLAVLTGPDVSPYETPLHFSGLGRAAVQMYANFTGLVYNPNNANGKILAGEKVRLVAKYDVAGPTVLNIQSLSMQAQTLDGV